MVSRERLVDTAKRRGFFFQTASQYGGVSGFYTLGPQGEALRQRIADSWRTTFITKHGFDEIRSPTVLPESIFRASGHLDSFDDAIVTCNQCGSAHRADHLVETVDAIEEAEGFSVDELNAALTEHNIECPTCKTEFEEPSVEPFNLMFKTSIGPTDGTTGYLRPETAQGTLAEFPDLSVFAREQTPFGMAQVGRAYRNEISPRKSVLRTREFSQAELQTFVFEDDQPPFERVSTDAVHVYQSETGDAQMTIDALASQIHPWLAYYIGLTADWLASLGVSNDDVRFRQHTTDELAHYAEDCWDAEIRLHEEWVEIAGIANRASHDLQAHADATGESYTLFDRFEETEVSEETTVDVDMSILGQQYKDDAPPIREALIATVRNDPSVAEQDVIEVVVDGTEYGVDASVVTVSTETVERTGEHRYPTVIEPAFGLERVLYAVMESAYGEDTVNDETRKRFAFPPSIAPTTVVVLPAVSNEDSLVEEATTIRDRFRDTGIATSYEDSGGIGRRYRRHDEIGTPFAVTVDRTTLDDNTVTLRERDSREQIRIPADRIVDIVQELRSSKTVFNDISADFPQVE